MKKILFLSTDPQGKAPEHATEEYANLDRYSKNNQSGDLIDLLANFEVHQHSLLKQLTAEQFYESNKQFKLLHFCLHSNDDGALFFHPSEVEIPNLIKTSKEELRDLLQPFKIDCVVLNCNSSKVIAEYLAAALEVPYIIGTQRPLLKEEAIGFVDTFYLCLFNQEELDLSVDLAYQIGRQGAKTNRAATMEDSVYFLIKNGEKTMESRTPSANCARLAKQTEALLKSMQDSNTRNAQTISLAPSRFADMAVFLEHRKAILAQQALDAVYHIGSAVEPEDFKEDLIEYLTQVRVCLETERFNTLNDPWLGTESEEVELKMLCQALSNIGEILAMMKGQTHLSIQSISFAVGAINHLVAQLEL